MAVINGTPGDDNLPGTDQDDQIHGLGGNDTIDGLGGNDQIEGGDGDDTLHGGDGNDEIRDGAGSDTLDGGQGTDHLLFTGALEQETVTGGEDANGQDNDLLDFQLLGPGLAVDVTMTGDESGTVDQNGSTELTFSEIEEFVLTQGSDTFDGTAASHRLVVNGGGGDDVIVGGAGNDTFFDGAGSDRLEGGAGSDTLNFENLLDGDVAIGGETGGGVDKLDLSLLDASAPVTVTMTGDEAGTVEQNGSVELNFSEIEQIDLTDGDDSFDGTATSGGVYVSGEDGDDTITGGAGNDTLHGDDGNDTLTGGAGNDRLQGDAGDDVITGGDGNDIITSGPGNDNVDGGAGNDIIALGSLAGESSSAEGGDGDDRIIGGAGNDLLAGGAGNDDITGGDAGNIIGGGTGNDTLHGRGGDDIITGGDGDDTLDGGTGVDRLSGEDGSDTFLVDGSSGNDTIIGGEDADGSDIDRITINAPFVVHYQNDDKSTEAGTIDILDAPGGNVVSTVTFSEIEVICFTADSHILTPSGERPVAGLRSGDRVVTRDGGAAPLRWVGRKRLLAPTLLTRPDLRPIRFARDSIAPGVPARDMMVSPQHRMLVTGAPVELHFGTSEALAPAKALVNDGPIRPVQDCEAVEYIHLLFDRHEVVRVDGAWSESFFPGRQALSGVEAPARDEVLCLFPELAAMPESYGPPARDLLKVHQARLITPHPAGKGISAPGYHRGIAAR